VSGARTEELRFFLRSAYSCYPWARRIFLLVADGDELPPWLDERAPRLRVVRHGAFMPPDALPCFNSNLIECFVHRVRGLSEAFVYCNSDMYTTLPTPKSFFFARAGVREGRRLADNQLHPVNRHMPGPGVVGPGAAASADDADACLYTRTWKRWSERYGLTDYRLQHQPMPYRRSLVRRYANRFGMAPVTSNRFRSLDDENLLRVSGALASQLGDAVRAVPEAGTEVFAEAGELRRIPSPEAVRRRRVRFLCVNNATDGSSGVWRKLAALFPDSGPAERERASPRSHFL
jgi:hypothetical protein